jgi:hypothetical protein
LTITLIVLMHRMLIDQRGGGIVKIAVQVEGGGRLTADVAPKSTLWECLLAAGMPTHHH